MPTKADTSVKWFHGSMLDAPALSSANGALVAILDACLINGFSTRVPDSVVVANEVATVSISAGNPYEKHTVIVISGANVPALNAEWRIAESGAGAFSFACPGVPDGVVTGSSIKRAAAGWLKPFADTNIGVYQSADPMSTQLYVRVDDRYSGACRVRGYEQMTAASVGTGLFPSLAQLAEDQLRWPKASQNKWALISDGAFFWLLLQPSVNTAVGRLMHHFGDIQSFVPGDRYHCTLCGVNGTSAIGAGHAGASASNTISVPRVYARGVSQTGGPIASFPISFLSAGVRWTSHVSANAPPDGVLRLGPPIFAHISTGSNDDFRGVLPGAVSTLSAPNFADLSIVEVGSRAFIAVECNATANAAGIGVAMFDVTGPWR